VSAGHEVAVHGWSHGPLPLRRPRSTHHDIARAHERITIVCGVVPAHYRPPYGVLTRSAQRTAEDLGLTTVLWSTWGRDWRARATPRSVRRDVGRRLDPGGTILLHDSDCTSSPGSWRSTLAALPDIVADIRSAGLEVGPLRERGLAPTGPAVRTRT
jgi:peptidoglycan/xylan/chitin deacetylase (PgdA/CDA1 family)